jgi:hypothetical protein
MLEAKEGTMSKKDEAAPPAPAPQSNPFAPAMQETKSVAQLFNFSSFKDAWDAAEKIATTSLIPKGYQGKPAEIVACWQFGLELGIPPMQSLTAIAVINGRPSLYGDGFLAVIQASPEFVDCDESYDAETQTARCIMRRRNRSDVERTFSMQEAQRAGLANKDGPWKNYPQRMLQMRARGFAGRDQFADVLRGMTIAEEASDLPEREVQGDTIRRSIPKPERSDESASERLLQAIKQRQEQRITSPLERPANPVDEATAVGTASDQRQPELAGTPPYTYDELVEKLKQAETNYERVNEVLDLARDLPEDDRKRLTVRAHKQMKGG